MNSKKGRVAVVTGGVTGIGAATCVALRDAGYKVIVNHFRTPEDARVFEAKTGLATAEWSVSNFDACAQNISDLTDMFGPIDILVNNAGITRDGMLHKMTYDQWNDVLQVDLGGCFNMCRAVIEGMRSRQFGRIVNISSINALSGQFGQTNYAAAKAGLIGFTKSLALESAAMGITVNAVAPGYTDTAMVNAVAPDILKQILATVPVGRLAQPEEIARAVVFLVSDDAGFITGETLSVNGGKYLQ